MNDSPERFFSEFGEDRWIAENLPLPDKGFYLDVGCAHPIAGSNTAFLRARGWRGLAIDANPLYAEHWRGMVCAEFLCAIVSDSPIVEFEFRADPGQSRVQPGAIRFAATPLWKLLPRFDARTVDVLSLDLEGAEFEALMSIKPFRFPPVIISEYNTAGLGEDHRVRDYLLKNGYHVAHTTTANHIFTR